MSSYGYGGTIAHVVLEEAPVDDDVLHIADAPAAGPPIAACVGSTRSKLLRPRG
ncbi:hypothetical protein CLV40_14118 [Actinokineospora auranticolor]|uniref:Uncharacterized protein n=1 Tax=Actinokineospora auranticolor TaxID=155976 RepID=A0A2S6GBY3_9PSEU|nr:hypothetical protein CLV40_14118 [Actinokineospora auranticolor]